MDKVVHFEIPASDLKKTGKFYSDVFGWNIKPYGEEYLEVTTVERGEDMRPKETGAINGGIQKRGERAKAPTIVVAVDDIDKKLKEIEAKGGKVAIKKEPIGDMGFYAQFDDIDGNRIGLFEPNLKMKR